MTDLTCEICSEKLSTDVGITIIFDGEDHHHYCAPCTTTGCHTIADLQRMKEEIALCRAEREIAMLDKLGPKAYFEIKGRGDE